MSDSYKIYASQDYVDNKGLPDGHGAYQQLVTDREGVVKWEEKPFYSETVQHAEEVFLEETSFSGTHFSITGFTSEFVVGTTYKVTLNGKVYESKAYYCDGDTAIGNPALIGPGGVEITESEYNRLLVEIREKAALVDQLYTGAITINDVPTDWQEEIQRRVNERIAVDGEAAQQEISGDELLTMIEEVL